MHLKCTVGKIGQILIIRMWVFKIGVIFGFLGVEGCYAVRESAK